MDRTRIPLFPLDLVLLPGQAIPLHIFEPRYREMTRHCIDSQSAFGILLERESKLEKTGCSALIVKVLKEYEDGRSDILTVGQSAFRLLETHHEKAYLEGEVEFLEDDTADGDPYVVTRLNELFNQCHELLYGEKAPPLDAEGGESLAYHVAAELPLETRVRQALLETRAEADRQARLIKYLSDWRPQLERREHLREKAGGNGHGKL